MQINEELLSKLENLSALKIDQEKRHETLEQLSQIVSFVEVLSELDLDDHKATFTTIEGGLPFREDIPKKNTEVVDIILKHAPKRDDRFFAVPSIIE